MTDLTPPGPTPDDATTPPAPRTGGLGPDDWLAHQETLRTQGPAAGTPYSAYGTPQRPLGPPSKTMAGWALGLSLAICIPFAFVVAFGLAIAVLVKGRDGRDHGKGMAIAAIVISSLIVIANIAYVVVVGIDMFRNGWDETERDSDGQVQEAGLVTHDRLRVGDCFDDDAVMAAPSESYEIETSGEVMAVPCSEPHDFETFHIVDIDAPEFPGAKRVQRHAAECLGPWRDYLGKPYRYGGTYELSYYFPTERSWRFGDRRIVCNIYRRDESPMVGSVRKD